MDKNKLLAMKHAIDLILTLEGMSQVELQYFKDNNKVVIEHLLELLTSKQDKFDIGVLYREKGNV